MKDEGNPRPAWCPILLPVLQSGSGRGQQEYPSSKPRLVVFLSQLLYVGQTLVRGGHCVKIAVLDRGAVVIVVCFQEGGGVGIAQPRLLLLLPPGKASVVMAVALRRDAEHADAQVGGDLDADACAVTRQVQQRQDLRKQNRER